MQHDNQTMSHKFNEHNSHKKYSYWVNIGRLCDVTAMYIQCVFYCFNHPESPEDYESLDLTLEFDECAIENCTRVVIIDDLRDEMEESFIVVLENPNHPRIDLDPDTVQVNIIDDDGEHKFLIRVIVEEY